LYGKIRYNFKKLNEEKYMRLKYSVAQYYSSADDFWRHSCNNKGRGCRYPETENYKKECAKLWDDWHKAGGRGKYPIMPPETIECEKCEYADLTLGRYQGKASLTVISRHTDGTIPVSLKGRKKVWFDNVNQKQLNSALNDISPDLEAFAISGSPSISGYSFLEKFPKLKYVYIWWNNKTECLWDIAKTPEVEFIGLDSVNRLSDISQVGDAKKLRYLDIVGDSGSLSSIKPLENHPSLEFLSLNRTVADMDIRPLITMPQLKYFQCQFNIFDIEAYAMFEARRPDVDTNFFEGLDDYDWEEKEDKSYFIGLVGKRQGYAEFEDKVKQKRHQEKYLTLVKKYLTVDFAPVLKSSKVASPVEGWKEALADGGEFYKTEQVEEIEKLLTDYANRMTSGIPKRHAKTLLIETIKKITAFNDRMDFIETEERQEIYDYLSSFINQKWYDEFEELLSDADW
jgi:hypothetical protein